MKTIFTIAFLLLVWLIPEKIQAQKSESDESVFSKKIEAIVANSCLRKKNLE